MGHAEDPAEGIDSQRAHRSGAEEGVHQAVRLAGSRRLRDVALDPAAGLAIATSTVCNEAIQGARRSLDCFAAFTTGRAFMRPGGPPRRSVFGCHVHFRPALRMEAWPPVRPL